MIIRREFGDLPHFVMNSELTKVENSTYSNVFEVMRRKKIPRISTYMFWNS